jgi:stage V sporulation protein SpoVS
MRVEIRVKKTTTTNGLAASIVYAIREEKSVVLRAIGPESVSAAIKAVSVANRVFSRQGFLYAAVPTLINERLPSLTAGEQGEADCVVTALLLVRLLCDAKGEVSHD